MGFIESLRSHGVPAGAAALLTRYADALLDENRRLNVSGADSPGKVLDHLLDSLTVIPYVRGPLIDVGSGGGFPAVPIAVLSGVSVTAVEATGKKAGFLRRVFADLQLPGEVILGRAEVLGHDARLRGKFASGTARAVGSAPTVVELLLPFLELGGVSVLQRGRMDADERQALADAAPMLGGEVEDEISLAQNRRIILIRKREETASRFPRRTGVPAKRPLCFT